MTFRHELKHELNMSDFFIMSSRLDSVLKRDVNSVDGKYEIRSLYFDNVYDKALREKISGVSRREKFRIRLYNRDTSVIHLEKKSKISSLGSKLSAELSVEETKGILSGDISLIEKREDDVIQEFIRKYTSDGLRPKTIVDYTRKAYTFPAGNVRVTLDYDIRTALHNTDILNFDVPTVPVNPGVVIMEVKWDEFLPDIVRNIITLDGRQTSAFSKYAACRIYD